MSRSRALLAAATIAAGAWATARPAESAAAGRNEGLLPPRPGRVPQAGAVRAERRARRLRPLSGVLPEAQPLRRGPALRAGRLRAHTSRGRGDPDDIRPQDPGRHGDRLGCPSRTPSGRPILAEEGRSLSPALVQGEQTYHVQQRWAGQDGESLYGLGQHQLGLLDIKGYDLDLWQHNATVVIPFLVSSRGYGHLLGQHLLHPLRRPARGRADPGRPPLRRDRQARRPDRPVLRRRAASSGSVATRVDPTIDIALSSKETQAATRSSTPICPDGEAQRPLGGRGPERRGRRLHVPDLLEQRHQALDRRPAGDRPLAPGLAARGTTSPGSASRRDTRYRVKLEWYKEQGMETVRLLWKTPSASSATRRSGPRSATASTTTSSTARSSTRSSPATASSPARRRLMPRWAFGLWQSRQRYETAQQSLDVVDGFRSRRIPFDNIVQDWFYWRENAVGLARSSIPRASPTPTAGSRPSTTTTPAS